MYMSEINHDAVVARAYELVDEFIHAYFSETDELDMRVDFLTAAASRKEATDDEVEKAALNMALDRLSELSYEQIVKIYRGQDDDEDDDDVDFEIDVKDVKGDKKMEITKKNSKRQEQEPKTLYDAIFKTHRKGISLYINGRNRTDYKILKTFECEGSSYAYLEDLDNELKLYVRYEKEIENNIEKEKLIVIDDKNFVDFIEKAGF